MAHAQFPFFFHVIKGFVMKQWCISRLSTTFVRFDEPFLPDSSSGKSIDSDERCLTFDCFVIGEYRGISF